MRASQQEGEDSSCKHIGGFGRDQGSTYVEQQGWKGSMMHPPGNRAVMQSHDTNANDIACKPLDYDCNLKESGKTTNPIVSLSCSEQ